MMTTINLLKTDGEDYDENGQVLRRWIINTPFTNIEIKDGGEATLGFGDYMFTEKQSVQSIKLSGLNTCNLYSMKGMFDNCINLKSIDTECIRTNNVKNMSRVFNSCANLSTIDVSNWNTAEVVNMEGMFYNCRNLSTIDVSNWNTNNVTDMGAMFSSCVKLTNLNTLNWNTNNVTKMASMFVSCGSLTELNLYNWSVQNTTNMSWMFASCSNLRYINLPHDMNQSITLGANLQAMGMMFFGCLNLSPSAYANIANSLPNLPQDSNLTLQMIFGMSVTNKFTEEQLNILNAKGYVDAVPQTPNENYYIKYD